MPSALAEARLCDGFKRRLEVARWPKALQWLTIFLLVFQFYYLQSRFPQPLPSPPVLAASGADLAEAPALPGRGGARAEDVQQLRFQVSQLIAEVSKARQASSSTMAVLQTDVNRLSAQSANGRRDAQARFDALSQKVELVASEAGARAAAVPSALFEAGREGSGGASPATAGLLSEVRTLKTALEYSVSALQRAAQGDAPGPELGTAAAPIRANPPLLSRGRKGAQRVGEARTQLIADILRTLPLGNGTAAQDARLAASAFSSSVDGVEAQAESSYWYQRQEKNVNALPVFQKYGPNWPCLWGEELVGVPNKDGGKWTCGLRALTQNCTVYSIGSNMDIGFEEGVLGLGRGCDIYVFDPTVNEPPLARPLGLKCAKVGIGTVDGLEVIGNVQRPVKTLASLMREMGHRHIDVLKIDIEWREHDLFAHLYNHGWPSVGQLLVEVHLHDSDKDAAKLDALFHYVERANFRLFHAALNWQYGPRCCIEYAFIQMAWRPTAHMYNMTTAASYQRIPILRPKASLHGAGADAAANP